MKKVCFLGFEGIIDSFKEYTPAKENLGPFLKDLTLFCKESNIELFLVSGFYEGLQRKVF